MAKNKLPKRMFKSRDVVSPYEADRSFRKLMKQVSRDHPDLLQNIEFVFVSSYSDDPSVDDVIVAEVLDASLKQQPPADSRVLAIYKRLQRVRHMRESVTDLVWHKALLVVYTSVQCHSTLQPGETSYLSYVAQFVAV